jgi:hypothetical protein
VTAVLAGSERTGSFRASRFRPGRALRLEIRHSAVVWVLPVLAVLFYANAYRRASGFPPVWTVRATALGEANVVFFSVIATGIAAWAATRESRRKTGDLLATTARAPWARQLTVLAATTFWNVLAYLAGVAVIYVQTALQATWGGPPLWPVAAGAVTVAASCAVGFVAGTLLPGRFTAPIVGVAVFVAWFIGVGAANTVNGFQTAADAKGSPALFVATDNGRPSNVDVGVFYRVLPDVSIAQVMFTGGVLLAMVGLLALLPAVTSTGVRGVPVGGRRWLAALAAVFVACGAAASATAFSLAGTARYSAVTGSWEIPALHDAADDQPVPYTLRCTGGGFQVCIHPAFDPYLSAMNAALQPAAAEIAGLPGAPARAEMTTGAVLPAVAGTTSVYEYSPDDEGFGGESFWTTAAGASTAAWEQGKQQDLITWFTTGPAYENAAGPTPAQEAVAIALLAKIGAPVPQYPQFTQFGVAGTHLGGSGGSSAFSSSGGPAGPQATAAQISAAAHRFGSLSPAAGRAWLTANMTALRSGAVTLAQLP